MKPLIGITTRFVHEDKSLPPLLGARKPYIDSVLKAGGIPVLIPIMTEKDAIRSLYARVNGILLPGGEDVDPSLYGEEPHPKLGEVCKLRDEMEIQIVKLAYEENKPLLGICRGVQVINVSLGGTLYQDIPSENPLWTDHGNKPPLWEHTPHELIIEPDSKLSSILNSNKVFINSLHHQAVRDVAKPLQVSGRTKDGVIEAVEAQDKDFFLGVQCHPELLWQKTNPKWLSVFEAFVRAASNFNS